MFRRLITEINKKAMNEAVEQLNVSVEKGSCFDFKDDASDEYGLWDWYFNKCVVCSKIWYMERATCNGATSEVVKLHNGLRCPHCGRGYCSFEHMKPQILVPNTDDINKLTSVKSCVIYKMCAAYLKHMTMSNHDDSFCSEESGYNTIFINGLISSESLNGVEVKGLRYVLMNQDVDYSDRKHYLKEDVVRFIDEHFNDCVEYKRMIAEYNAYTSTDAKMIISTFVGCRNCLK